MSEQRSWQGRSRGGRIGHAIIAGIARGGPGLLYPFVVFPAGYFFCRDALARRAILDYWRLVLPRAGRWQRLCRALRHFHHFACMLSDRFLVAFNPELFPCRHLGARSMLEAMADPRGCILLSAHFGNWELSGRWLSRYADVVINIVMLQAEDPAVREKIEEMMGEHPFHIIDLADPYAAGVAIAAALSRGETCCMLGDRTAGSQEASNRLPFLGREARFPTGPFLAALVTGAPVVPTFAVKRGAGYDMIAWPAIRVQAARRRDRQQAIRRAQQTFVRYLSYQVRRDPYQWHNFFDFWDQK
jgi:predicted LPLAT superfamily acyltransferase